MEFRAYMKNWRRGLDWGGTGGGVSVAGRLGP